MTRRRATAAILLALLLLASAFLLAHSPFDYAAQDRNAILAPASAQHPAGTDALGRDRAVRSSAALCIGLAGASTAAAATVLVAAAIGIAAAFAAAPVAGALMLLSDVFLSLPWLFLLMMVRSGLALETSPARSAVITFAILAALGWPACARAVFRGTQHLRLSGSMLYGRAAGLTPTQLVRLHILPHLKPLLLPQFLVSVPAFLIAEANLGTLGLGIAEPLPSWGALLEELNHPALLARTHWVYLPIILLIIVLLLLESMLSNPRENA